MNVQLKTMSLDEFIAWEERQELRYEFDGVDVEAMTGGTGTHSLIQTNLIAALRPRLRGGPCRVHGSELKVRTSTSIRYPDAMVVCAKADGRETSTSAPTVLFEILSPSTASKDLGVKNAEYQTLETLRRYIVLHQDAVAAEVFYRGDEGEWAHQLLIAEGALSMPEIGVDLPLSACYEDIDMDRRA